MALNTNTTGTVGFPDAIAKYYEKKRLSRLEFDLHLQEWAEKKPMPKNSGNEIVWTRHTNFGANVTPLVEGVTPNGLTMQSVQISAIPLQYGDYVALSDYLIAEAIDPVMEGAIELLTYRQALSADTIVRNTLHGNVTDQFAGGAANEAAIVLANVFNAPEARKAAYKLRKLAVRPVGDSYAAVVHPAQIFDLQSDNSIGSWLEINKYTTTGPLYKGEIGKMYGIRFVESQNIQFVNNGTVDVYRAFVFGKEGYGTTELSGNGNKMITKQLGSGGTEDPLDQRATVGFKYSFVCKVLDAQRIIEVHSASAAV